MGVLPGFSGQSSSFSNWGSVNGLRFVSLMGGQIWLESEGLRKGCTAVFVVKLGLCDNDKYPSFRRGSVAPPGQPPRGGGDAISPSRILQNDESRYLLRNWHQRNTS